MAGTSDDDSNKKEKRQKKKPSIISDQPSEAFATMGRAYTLAAASAPEQRNDDNTITKGNSKPEGKTTSKKRPHPAGMHKAAIAAAIKASGSLATTSTKSSGRGRAGTLYVGRRKGFIDDSELPEDETPEEKKRRLNRNNERRKRARRVFKIDYLSDRKAALEEKNERIKNDNQTLRTQIALIRERVQSGGNLSDLDLTQGLSAILPAVELASLAASSPAPTTMPHPGDQMSSARSVLVPSQAHPPTRSEGTRARSLQESKGSPQTGELGLQRPIPEQSQMQVPLPALTSPVGTNRPVNNFIMDAFQQETLLQAALGRGSGIAHGNLGLRTPSNVRDSALLASLLQDRSHPRSDAMEGLETSSDISWLRQELLQAQQAATNRASYPGSRFPTGLLGLGGQMPNLTRRSSDPLSSATLQQRLLDLSSRTPVGADGLGSDLMGQLRSQLGQRPQASALQFSGLLPHAMRGQTTHPTDPFMLSALQQQQHNQWSSAALASRVNRPLSAHNIGGMLSQHSQTDSLLNTLANVRRASGSSRLAAVGNPGGFGLQPMLSRGGAWLESPSLSISQREAALMQMNALNAAEQRNRLDIDRLAGARTGDSKGDDDEEKNQSQGCQDPRGARPQR